MVLLGLGITPPETVDIALAFDLSDSCIDLSKILGHVKKLLRLLPSDCPLSLFTLSSPHAISRSGLRLQDLNEAENWQKEICIDTNFLTVGKRRGSFLRPVLETLNVANVSRRRLLIVLSDGRFNDFGYLDIPASLEILCIVPNAAQATSGIQRPTLGQVTSVEIQNVEIEKIIARYAQPFFGPVIIEPKLDASKLDKFYRVDADGRIINWLRSPNHIVNLALGRQFLLFDGSIEDAQLIRWQIKSCSNESTKILQGSKVTLQPQPILEGKISQHFTQRPTESINETICCLHSGDAQFNCLVEQFEQASDLATQGKPWVDDDGSLQVFSHLEDTKHYAGEAQRQQHAIVAVMVQCRQTGAPLHLTLFSLSREKRPSLQFTPESPSNQLVAVKRISIEFCESRYRWILIITETSNRESQQTTELEYYAAEKLALPLNHPDGIATVLFSGNLS